MKACRPSEKFAGQVKSLSAWKACRCELAGVRACRRENLTGEQKMEIGSKDYLDDLGWKSDQQKGCSSRRSTQIWYYDHLNRRSYARLAQGERHEFLPDSD